MNNKIKNCSLCKNKTDLNNLNKISDNYIKCDDDKYVSYGELINETLDIEVILQIDKNKQKVRHQTKFIFSSHQLQLKERASASAVRRK